MDPSGPTLRQGRPPPGHPPPDGLTAGEVATREAAGQVNGTTLRTSRTLSQIVRANVFTRFNAILGVLLAVIVVVGPFQDALFGLVLAANTAIGIFQEVRAKRALDRLALVAAPRAAAVRDGQVVELPVEGVVVDDVLRLESGDQVVVDGEVVAAEGLEVDESLLTGEADPVSKGVGADVLSGSFAAAGTGWYRAARVGQEAYAARLAKEAQQFAPARSELRAGIDRILRGVTWLMVPTAILLVSTQLVNSEDLPDALRGSVAGVGSMVPEGLVLLTSVAMAVGVLRLGRRKVLVQELAAVETLARVDVVCLDKTGTLTEGRMAVSEVELLEPVAAGEVLGALAGADPAPNASMRAIATTFPPPDGWQATDVVPFSSARKWSAAAFGPLGAWVLGAPEVMGERSTTREFEGLVSERAAAGSRVLLLARSPGALAGQELPDGLEPAALVVLDDQIREEAPATLDYFTGQGVTLKVISGDDPRTVGAIAARLEVDRAEQPVDARHLPTEPEPLADAMEASSVFGRVSPKQKQAMVVALQSRGHVVAMTGDGVNDVLALKNADIGVALGSGSAAARAVAQLVLVSSSFDALPAVVAEGRRVIANVERVANLFLTKTVYATLLALAVGVAGLPFPFLPRHLTVITTLTIGTPAFFLALAPNAERARPGFLRRVLGFAVPAGAVAAAATFATYAIVRAEHVSLAKSRTTATMVLFIVAFWALTAVARPLTTLRRVLLAAMAAAAAAVLTIPGLREFYGLEVPPVKAWATAVILASAAVLALEVGWQVATHWHHRRERRAARDAAAERAAAVDRPTGAPPEPGAPAEVPAAPPGPGMLPATARMTAQMRLRQSPEQVFDYLSDAANLEKWNPGTGEMEIRTVSCDRPKRLAFEARAQRMDVQFTFEVAPAEAGTTVEVAATIKPVGAMVVMTPLLGAMLRRTFEDRARQLQAALDDA